MTPGLRAGPGTAARFSPGVSPMQRRVVFVGLVVCVLWTAGRFGAEARGADPMKAGVQKSDYGKTADGKAVDLYTLANAKGMTAKVTTYGAILTELDAPDKD